MRRPIIALTALTLIAASCDQGPETTASTEPTTTSVAAAPTTAGSSTSTTATISEAIPTTAPGCETLLAAFSAEPAANARCVDGWLLFDGTGLAESDPPQPDLRMMVGITAWILRVPVPYAYEWRIPTDPVWLDEITEASPRGPIAVAVDGVPIFHYERRPDVSTHPEHYDPASDTVVQGELDHCGGHSGQGDDYHYHYAPVCLADDHDLSLPIAFGLDGAPVYYGTGGTEYYGFGHFDDIDLLPAEPLDECNAIQLEDGSWIHYTTSTPPYVIGCHHGYVDPSLQIEPRPMREQGVAAPYGGLVGEPSLTRITDWYVDDDGWMHLEHTSFEDGMSLSAVVYRQAAGDDCWEFDFRAVADTPGVVQTHCRP